MSYNAVTITPSPAMSSPTAPGPTPKSNARDIAALTSAVDMLVSRFIRPATQQANANRATLDEVIELLSRHAQGLLGLEQRLDSPKVLARQVILKPIAERLLLFLH